LEHRENASVLAVTVKRLVLCHYPVFCNTR
jgi:hypothetical protein